MITIDELKAKLGGMKTSVDDLRDALSIEASEKRLAELEHQMTLPGFYDDQARSQKIISEMGEVKNKLERFGKLKTQYEEAETLLEMIEEENDPALAAEGEEAVEGVEKSIDELQLMTMLNGEYDHSNAILTFHAGTGGTEAQDWAEMLMIHHTIDEIAQCSCESKSEHHRPFHGNGTDCQYPPYLPDADTGDLCLIYYLCFFDFGVAGSSATTAL